MDASFLSFIINSREPSIPYPWERCYDFRTESLFYKNQLNGVLVVDLRPRVNLGGGLVHESSFWHDTITIYSLIFREFRENRLMNQERSFVLDATCCTPFVYLIVPEPVQRCPLCFRHLIMSHA